jgi:hypothetical protein
MDVKEAGYEDMDWIHLSRGRQEWQALVSGVVIPEVAINVMEFFENLNDCYVLKN